MKKFVKWVSVAEEMNPSCRSTMEDTYTITEWSKSSETGDENSVVDNVGTTAYLQYTTDMEDAVCPSFAKSAFISTYERSSSMMEVSVLLVSASAAHTLSPILRARKRDS